MAALKLSDIAEGTRVTAPCSKMEDEVLPGVIVDNLSAMYYIAFDCGTEDYVFKAQDVRPIETE